MTIGLSKSRIIEWRQCPRRLWLRVHRPDLLDRAQTAERVFRIGNDVGEVARQLFPDGYLIETRDLREAMNLTATLLADNIRKPLFEATFQRDGVLVQVDLLLPEENGFRMVEVKSSTSVKDYHLADAAMQRWVVAASISLTGVEVAHVNREFVYPGGGDYRGLLTHVSVDDETTRLSAEVPDWIAEARAVLGGGEPCIQPGRQCTEPFECPFLGHCNSGRPKTDFPLSALPRLSARKREELEAGGVVDIREIPDDVSLSGIQARIRRITIGGKPELSGNAASDLRALSWPRYYLDFETVSMAVPCWPGTRPYQKLPVQWSCHIEAQDGTLEHRAFLAEGFDDPRRPFAESLLSATGSEGPILVYNQSFELGRIEELASDLPDLAEALRALASRVVDLLPITRENYYHPAMQGSWSIKDVLPTIGTDLSYSNQEIGDGGAAEEAWLEILHPATSADRCLELHKALADYCGLDTLAMVRLARFLSGSPA